MRYSDKSWLRFGGLFVLVVAMALAGCAGDDGKDGVDGTDGAQGPTGPEGPEGPPGTTICMNCHTDSWDMDNYILTKQAEYATSLHATGETYVRKSATCSRCHTAEGFQNYVETGEGADLTHSSHIGCFTCHAPHSNENFDLRTMTAVTLMVGGGTFDKEESNLCANCHQGREVSPAVDDPDTPITSSRWGAHHGPQANILSGQGCWEIGGTAYDSGHMHNTAIPDGCVNCHMADAPSSGLAGGHSWWLTYEYHGAEEANSAGCVTCHSSWDDATAMEEIETFQAEFQTELDTLKGLLVAAGWINDSDSVIPDNAPTAADDRGALLNYQMLREDRSGGVHNPTYAMDVVEASIAHMQGKAIQ